MHYTSCIPAYNVNTARKDVSDWRHCQRKFAEHHVLKKDVNNEADIDARQLHAVHRYSAHAELGPRSVVRAVVVPLLYFNVLQQLVQTTAATKTKQFFQVTPACLVLHKTLQQISCFCIG